MLKIAIITNNYKPYSGGVVSSIDSFAKKLREFGNHVDIVTLNFTNNDLHEDYLYRINCPIKFKYKNNPLAIPLRPFKDLYSIIKELKPDIIHTQHPFLLGQCALRISKELNIPIVFTYHTRYDQYLHYIPLPNFLTKPITNKITINYCNQIDGIVAPSDSIYNYLKTNEIKKPITTIASGILPVYEMNEFKQKKLNKAFNLLTVSRFVKEKNIYFLLDVFCKLNSNQFTFTLIGYGPEIVNLKKYAYQKLKISQDRLQFLEKPSKEIISQYYKDSDLFIFASKTETQGLVLAEAMSSGTPVLALNATGSCDIIKNDQNGFLIENQNQMIELIKKIAINESLHKRLQYNAWQTGQLYNSKSTTQNLINFYRDIIEKKKS